MSVLQTCTELSVAMVSKHSEHFKINVAMAIEVCF